MWCVTWRLLSPLAAQSGPDSPFYGHAAGRQVQDARTDEGNRTIAARGRRYRVVNVTRGETLADSSRRPSTFVGRGVGLIGRRSLPPGGGLIIDPSNSVVSFFMRFPIDVLFLDRENQVRHLIHRMVPWRISKIVRRSKRVVELPAGTLARTGTELGDVIEISPATLDE